MNNPTEEDEQVVQKYIEENGVYGCYGREVGEGGTPHLQGYLILSRKQRLVPVKQGLGGRCHLEPMRGSVDDNEDYCTKEGDVWRFGNKPLANGKRCRDEVAKAVQGAVKHGREGLDRFIEENPGVWAWDGQRILRNVFTGVNGPHRPDIRVRWIWGEPGVGKSRMADELYPNAFRKEPKNKWWCGYLMEKEVIMDDYTMECVDLNYLLRWFDRYPCLVETKGAWMPLYADKWVITSNMQPRDIFAGNLQLDALLRRIEVTHMANLG